MGYKFLALLIGNLNAGVHLGGQPAQVVVHMMILQIGDIQRSGQSPIDIRVASWVRRNE